MPNVVIVQNDRELAERLDSELSDESDFSIEVVSGPFVEIQNVINSSFPDIVIMGADYGEPQLEALANWLSGAHPRASIVVLGEEGSEDRLQIAIDAGAHAYISTQMAVPGIADRLKRLQAGDVLVASEKVQNLKQIAGSRDPETGAHTTDRVLESLSPRELQILRLIAQGASDQEVGDSLAVAGPAAKFYVNDLIKKLGVGNRKELAVWAVSSGIADAERPEGGADGEFEDGPLSDSPQRVN